MCRVIVVVSWKIVLCQKIVMSLTLDHHEGKRETCLTMKMIVKKNSRKAFYQPCRIIQILQAELFTLKTHHVFYYKCGFFVFVLSYSQTNLYHHQIEKYHKTSAKISLWMDVTYLEIKIFLGLIILTGLTKKPEWSTNPLFSKPVTAKRFKQILIFFHLNSNSQAACNTDHLYKLRPLLGHLSQISIFILQNSSYNQMKSDSMERTHHTNTVRVAIFAISRYIRVKVKSYNR